MLIKYSLIFILLGSFSLKLSGQYLKPIQYSSFCKSDVYINEKQIKERIHYIDSGDYNYKIKMTVIDDCGVKLYPTYKINQDTLFVITHQIEEQKAILENNDTIWDLYIPEECYCAYVVNIELPIHTYSIIIVNQRELTITSEQFKTFPIKYSVFEGDTTSFTDQYGLKQGYTVFKNLKKGYYIYSHFKNNKAFKYELYDIHLNLVFMHKDYFELLDMVEKKF